MHPFQDINFHSLPSKNILINKTTFNPNVKLFFSYLRGSKGNRKTVSFLLLWLSSILKMVRTKDSIGTRRVRGSWNCFICSFNAISNVGLVTHLKKFHQIDFNQNPVGDSDKAKPKEAAVVAQLNGYKCEQCTFWTTDEQLLRDHHCQWRVLEIKDRVSPEELREKDKLTAISTRSTPKPGNKFLKGSRKLKAVICEINFKGFRCHNCPFASTCEILLKRHHTLKHP